MIEYLLGTILIDRGIDALVELFSDPECRTCQSTHDVFQLVCCGGNLCRRCGEGNVRKRWLRANLFRCPLCFEEKKV